MNDFSEIPNGWQAIVLFFAGMIIAVLTALTGTDWLNPVIFFVSLFVGVSASVIYQLMRWGKEENGHKKGCRNRAVKPRNPYRTLVLDHKSVRKTLKIDPAPTPNFNEESFYLDLYRKLEPFQKSQFLDLEDFKKQVEHQNRMWHLHKSYRDHINNKTCQQ